MAIKFILDEAQKKEEAIVQDILETIKHKPKQDENVKKLATFLGTVFRTQMGKKPRKEQYPAQPEILKPAPIELEKTEYLVKLFNTPVGILLEKGKDKYSYTVMEPQEDAKLVMHVKNAVRKHFMKNPAVLEDAKYMQAQTARACKELGMEFNADTARRAAYYLKRDLLGFRRIDPLMHDVNVRAIYCEGTDRPVRIAYKGLPDKTETNVIFTDPKDLNTLINKIAAFAGASLSPAHPVMDVITNGFKIQATMGIGGISSKLTIKKL